jgi:hypothetical protein
MRLLLVVTVLFTSLLVVASDPREQSSSSQSSPAKQPSTPSAPQKTSKVWTNDDFAPTNGATSSSARGRSSSEISITSPADGTVVKPGEVITVRVRVAVGKSINRMAVISPLGYGDELRSSPPWTFTLTVPTDERGVGGGRPLIGRQPVHVMTFEPNKSQQGEPDASITVDVEEPDIPTKLWTQWTQLIFDSADDREIPLDVVGTFPDGLQLDVAESTSISYKSTDTQVATVSDIGMVKPAGPGKAYIYVTYGSVEHGIQLPVPVSCGSPPTPDSGIPRPPTEQRGASK